MRKIWDDHISRNLKMYALMLPYYFIFLQNKQNEQY